MICMLKSDANGWWYYEGNQYRGYLWYVETEETKDSFVAGVGQLNDGEMVRVSQ